MLISKLFSHTFSWAINGLFFLYFCLSKAGMFIIKLCSRLDSNYGPLAVLSTEPQPLPKFFSILCRILFKMDVPQTLILQLLSFLFFLSFSFFFL